MPEAALHYTRLHGADLVELALQMPKGIYLLEAHAHDVSQALRVTHDRLHLTVCHELARPPRSRPISVRDYPSAVLHSRGRVYAFDRVLWKGSKRTDGAAVLSSCFQYRTPVAVTAPS